ncbi:MAG: segregation/condensation protein A [Actinobacteria bacterium]|nr:segregation/condensation protein A [Actinomycetota bacterium]MCL5882701.1 segregation/condensation protein A [Actinomycetota bacterium]
MPYFWEELMDLDLEVFQGPFDLLLTLILKEEISIFEVSLSDIVISYLEKLEAEDELDLEAASEFLILMSALLEIKSAQLLPRPEELDLEELTPEEAREELVIRLITYKKFKEAAAWLRARHDVSRYWRFRAAPLPKIAGRAADEEVPHKYDPSKLTGALKVLLAEPPEIHTDHMTKVTANVWEQMKTIRQAVRHKAKVAFDEIVGGADRVTQAVTFFALLEMYNSGELEVEQEQLFGRILIYEAEKSSNNKLIA